MSTAAADDVDVDEGGQYEDLEDEPPAEPLLPEEPKSPESTPISCCCLLWSLIWLAILVAFVWPLSLAMAAIYGFVAPLITLFGLDEISESMLQAVNVGRQCALNVRTGKPMV